MLVRLSTLFFSGIALCLFVIFYISLPPAHQSSNASFTQGCDCAPKKAVPNKSYSSSDKRAYKSRGNLSQDKHNLAVLVPFRDRFDELLEFIPQISAFLDAQHKRHHIFIINQGDGFRFNRASLLNAGFQELPPEFDHVALHDVDLIPLNRHLHYPFPERGPFHVSAPHLHPRYHYPTFIGGVLLIRRDHYQLANGMSNRYWGWGLEDDEFYARLRELKLEVFRPTNLTTGTKDTFRHLHNRRHRRRDMIKCHNQQEVTRRRDRLTGLSTSRYRVPKRTQLSVGGFEVTLLNVELECDLALTPWCNCTQNVGNSRRPDPPGASSYDVIVPKLNPKKHLSPDG